MNGQQAGKGKKKMEGENVTIVIGRRGGNYIRV